MERREEIKNYLAAYAAAWPQLEIDDLLKLLYQSAFGCGHFAPGFEQVTAYLDQELRQTQADADAALVEPILGGFARVNIAPYAAQGKEIATLARLFMLTADEPPRDEAKAWFDGALALLEEMADADKLPFSAQAMRARLDEYRAAGCPSLHHSKRFGAAYHPAYRVVRAQYAQLLSVFGRIDTLLREQERVIVAIDGNSGSGKSTLAKLLGAVYPEAVCVHMDDFFLQMHQRTSERFAQPGGNVDHERFLEEVLAPMRAGKTVLYRPFDCSRMAVGEGKEILPEKLCIVEGSYSLHPSLESAYDLKIVLRISSAQQAERILLRNGPQMLGRFLNEWIPMENRYFAFTQIEKRCDLLLDVAPLPDGNAGYEMMETEGRA